MTTKQIMFIVLSVLLVLVVIVMSVVLTRISNLLQLFMGPGPSPTTPSSDPVDSSPSGSTAPSYSVPTAPSVPPSSAPTIPSAPSSVPTAPGHAHEFVLVQTVPATCETSGYSVYACSCGKDDTRDLTDPLGHSYTEKVVAPTCDADGYTLHKCQRCSSEERSNEVSATGHSYGDWEIAQPPVGDPLTQLQRTCAKCGDVQLQDQPQPPTEPSEPALPSEPDTPTEPSEPDTPTEPSEPDTPTEPSEPDTPTEPSEPSEPEIPETT